MLVYLPAPTTSGITNVHQELLTARRPRSMGFRSREGIINGMQEIVAQARKWNSIMLGEFLSSARKKKGLSQKRLADGLCSRAHVSHIERGQALPNVRLLEDFASRLEMPFVSFAEAYLASEPSFGQTLSLALKLAANGDIALAKKAYIEVEESLQKGANSSLLREYTARRNEVKGLIELMTGEIEVAVTTFQAALKSASPSSCAAARIQLRLGLMALKLENLHLARDSLMKAFRTILWINPEESKTKTETVINLHQQIVMNLGITLLRQRDLYTTSMVLQSASDAWQEYGILHPWSPELLMVRALAEVGTGRFIEARKSLEEILQAKAPPRTRASALHNLGLLCRIEGNFDEAQEGLQQAWDLYVSQDAGNPQAICNELARCALEKRQKSAVATWLTRAERFTVDNPDPMAAVNTMLLRAKEALANDEPALAQDYLERIEVSESSSSTHKKLLWIEQARLALALDDESTINRKLDMLERELTPEAL